VLSIVGGGTSAADLEARIEVLEQKVAALEAEAAQQFWEAEFSSVIGTLEPMQASSETVFVLGLQQGKWVGATFAADYTWLTITASCVQDNTVRVLIQNIGPVAFNAGTISFKLTYANG
jgi:hypothetical protein